MHDCLWWAPSEAHMEVPRPTDSATWGKVSRRQTAHRTGPSGTVRQGPTPRGTCSEPQQGSPCYSGIDQEHGQSLGVLRVFLALGGWPVGWERCGIWGHLLGMPVCSHSPFLSEKEVGLCMKPTASPGDHVVLPLPQGRWDNPEQCPGVRLRAEPQASGHQDPV